MNLIRLQDSDRFGGFTVRILDGSNREDYVQSDWEIPGLAEQFGWWTKHDILGKGECPDWRSTDGTIECKGCGMTPSEFMHDAAEYLENHIGDKIEDIGYFNFE